MDLVQTKVSVANGDEADQVVDRMKEMLLIYGLVSISDFFQLINIRTTHEDYMFGWLNLDDLKITYSKGEYTFELPPTIKIK